jgi:adenosylmethionine-8-amino-7-oxononanoate aminotransferase
VREVGEHFRRTLETALSRYDEVGDVRGRGFFVGVEIVKNRESKTPFAAKHGINFEIGRHAFADGLIVYPCSGNVDGIGGDTVILAPPYNASDSELETIIQKLSKAIGMALAGQRD